MNQPAEQPRGASRRRGAARRRTRVIAVANQKGGVGKSTTAVSLGAALAELGHRVLVVDLDPQGNASTGLGIRHERRKVTVYDVLAAEAAIEGAVVPTPVDGLFAIPSTIDLAGAEIELVSQFSRELRLRRALEPLKDGAYDFVFLDCPPSLGLLTVNALAAADELIVPIQCEYYALEGLGQLLRNVRLVQQNVNPGLHLTGIVMTMYDPRTKLSEQVVEEVRRFFGDRVYATVIPRTVRLSEAPGFGQPITVYDPRSRGAESYRELAREVAARLPSEEPIPVFDHISAAIPPPDPEPAQAPRPLRPGGGGEAVAEEAEGPAGEEGEGEGQTEDDLEVSSPAIEPPIAAPLRTGTEREAQADTPLQMEVAAPGGSRSEPPVADAGLHPDREPSLDRGSSGTPAASGSAHPSVEAQVETGERAAPRPRAPEGHRGPSVEGATARPDADGTEAWIAGLEAEARLEQERAGAAEQAVPGPVAEVDLESEPEPEGGGAPEDLVRIVDRDAAGEHGPEGLGATAEERADKRWWRLFRRGGGR